MKRKRNIIGFFAVAILIVLFIIPLYGLVLAYNNSFLDGIILTINFIILFLIIIYKEKIKSFFYKLFKK